MSIPVCVLNRTVFLRSFSDFRVASLFRTDRCFVSSVNKICRNYTPKDPPFAICILISTIERTASIQTAVSIFTTRTRVSLDVEKNVFTTKYFGQPTANIIKL